MSNKELDSMWEELETEEGYEWYEDTFESHKAWRKEVDQDYKDFFLV